MAVVDGVPSLNMTNGSGASIVNIAQGIHAGGKVELGNPEGDIMVQAGVEEDGRGVVVAFPLGVPGGGMMGMPGTFLRGWKKGGQ
jgi:hypothetical protein